MYDDIATYRNKIKKCTDAHEYLNVQTGGKIQSNISGSDCTYLYKYYVKTYRNILIIFDCFRNQKYENICKEIIVSKYRYL